MSKSRLCVVKAFARSFPRYWSQSVVSQGGRTTAHRQTAPSEKHVQVQLSAPAMRREDDLNQPFLGHKDRGSPRPEGRGFPFLVHGPCSRPQVKSSPSVQPVCQREVHRDGICILKKAIQPTSPSSCFSWQFFPNRRK